MLAASLLAARKGMTSYAGCQLAGSQEIDDILLAASLLVARKAMTSCWQPFVHFFTLNFLLGYFVNQNVSCNLALGC